MTRKRQFDKQSGSALILVVVVTVLLAVIGVMFLMVSRTSEMETAAVIQSKDLDNAVDSVVSRINETLVDDLLDNGDLVLNPHDAATDDPWLSDLEPDWSTGNPQWIQFSDVYLTQDFPASPLDLEPDIAEKTTEHLQPADADGDGVTDSYWVQVPKLTSSRGEPVFSAVRIIDNCAMLNLNAAHCFYQNDPINISPFKQPWYEDSSASAPYHDNQTGTGRLLTEINYLPFLRRSDLTGGSAKWYNIQTAKGFGVFSDPAIPEVSHNVLINIENPGPDYHFFDIGDELELRNRYLLTSKTESRLERSDVANPSLDPGSEVLEIPRDDSGRYPIQAWNIRINPENFNDWDIDGNPIPVSTPEDLRYRYDRRHVCTVYSYDRQFRKGDYPLLDSQFASLTAGWRDSDITDAQRVFWPIGPVTTNIAVLTYNAISEQWEYNTNNTETRRKILHLLFAFRDYFNEQDPSTASKRAAQVVANIIDYSDDDAPNNLIPGESEGPFYYPRYGEQANMDCTFISEQIIQDMMLEVSSDILGSRNGFSIPFGLDSDIVFGYEKQPFISEVFLRWDGGAEPPNPHLIGFAIELINPYDTPISILDWKLKLGSAIDHTFAAGGVAAGGVNDTSVPEYSDAKGPGRLVIQINSTGTVPADANSYNIARTVDWVELERVINTQSLVLLRPDRSSSTTFLNVDAVSTTDLQKIVGVSGPLGGPGNNALKRDDNDWGFVQGQVYEIQTEGGRTDKFEDTLGNPNNVKLDELDGVEGFQLGVADDSRPLSRWHELEILGVYGNGPESTGLSSEFDPQDVITHQLKPDSPDNHFDLTEPSDNPLDYVATISRPDFGSLPGRININTASVHVIAAAIPPTLADPDAATGTVTLSALQLAQEIVDYRQSANGPFKNVSELLNVSGFKQYIGSKTWADPDAGNVGSQSIEDDIEEEHWVLSNLANKLTVRSDVFTAYILVRLGEDGPQRRMIGIFDRSKVWDKNGRPKLVALHPVPDPR